MFNPFKSAEKFVSYHSNSSCLNPNDYIIEPWQKNTTQMDNKAYQQRAYKTFYQVPLSKPKYNANNTERKSFMQKTFSYRKECDSKGIKPEQSNRQVSNQKTHNPITTDHIRKGSISQYNLDNSCFVQIPETSQRRFSNQFHTRRLRLNRQKNREQFHKRHEESENPYTAIRINLQSIKKRVSMNKQAAQAASSQLVRISSQNQFSLNTHLPVNAWQKRKNKVIALGFQKISILKGLNKQPSLKFSHHSPFV